MSQVHNLTAESVAVFRALSTGKLMGMNFYNGAAVRLTVREGSATGRILLAADLGAAGFVSAVVPGASRDGGADFNIDGLWVKVESGAISSALIQVYTT